MSDDFEHILEEGGPGLHRALVAAYGPEVGSEASADAIAWGWEHRRRVESMGNPVGYLFRVGQSKARRYRRDATTVASTTLSVSDAPSDPDLVHALGKLTVRQRAAVVLVHGYGYQLAEAAAVLGCSVSTLRNHVRRGLQHLHRDLEESHAVDR